jgi:Ca2+-binding RTX toxin-like protein
MKHAFFGILCAAFVSCIGAEMVGAADNGFKASLVTSEAASRASVELTEDGATVATLRDGEGNIGSGEVEIDGGGDVTLQLESEATGTAFILINQADTDSDGDRDFVFSGLLTLNGGEVDVEFPEAIPVSTSIEDLLVTAVLDNGEGDQPGVLDGTDTILAVPGLTVEEEEAEPEEFEVEYEDGSCEDLFGEDVEVKVEGTVVDSTNQATKVEFLEEAPETNEIHCTAGERCVGTNGDDIIYGTSGPDQIFGGNGNDIIYGNDGNDDIRGGNGKDTIYGEGGDDTIMGQNGRDELDGGEGADIISGGNGRDTIHCDEEDNVSGGLGRDETVGCEE